MFMLKETINTSHFCELISLLILHILNIVEILDYVLTFCLKNTLSPKTIDSCLHFDDVALCNRLEHILMQKSTM